MVNRLPLFLVAAVIISMAHAAVARAEIDPWSKPLPTFPSGPQATLPSPDRRYELQNVDSDTQEPAHSIFLLDRKTGQRTLLYQYGRWVNVLWSPSSSAIVVNDFFGSDDSTSVLILVSPRLKRLNLWKLLLKSKAVTSKMRRDFQGYPVFKCAVGWFSADRLVFRVAGFREAGPTGFKNPFAYSFSYQLGATFVLLETREGAEQAADRPPRISESQS